MRHRAHALACLLLLSGPVALAQQQPRLPPVDSVRAVALRLKDGTELVGRVVAATDSSVVLVTPAGLQVKVPRAALVSWRARAGAIVGARLVQEDPNVSRLFFAPTARTLAAGDGYFGDYYLFFPFVAYGVTDRFTISGGMSLIPAVSLGDQLYFIAPKVGLVRTPSFGLAVGVLYGGAALASEGASGGVGYAVGTVGSEDQAITAGLGWPFVVGEGGTTSPWGMLGAETRLSGRVKLLAELWKLPAADEIPGVFGLRFFGERMAVDFGLIHVIGADMGNWPFIPWLDFVVHW
jgi:hypothetical protein